jgi:hypothetical protein
MIDHRLAILSQSVKRLSTVPALHQGGEDARIASMENERMTASRRTVPRVFSDIGSHSLKTG